MIAFPQLCICGLFLPMEASLPACTNTMTLKALPARLIPLPFYIEPSNMSEPGMFKTFRYPTVLGPYQYCQRKLHMITGRLLSSLGINEPLIRIVQTPR